jgi:hypothetical protein
MATPISQCSVFIQIWIDTNAVQAGQTKGIYLVDNRTSGGSQNEGSVNLQTNCTRGSFICWTIIPIDPNFVASGGSVQIQSIGNSNVWGDSGQPQRVDSWNFTGQAQSGTSGNYALGLNVQAPGGSGISLSINPGIAAH